MPHVIEEARLASDELEVSLLPSLGCRLHRLRAFGVELLRTPEDPATHADDPFFWGAYVMAPWTNRATARPMTISGRTVDLAANFADGTAIHGQVYAAPWEQRGPGSFAIRHEGGGWPWAYEVTAEIAVEGPRVRLAYAVTNRSDGPMPAGIGLHPWFRRPIHVGAGARQVHPRNDDPAAEPVDPTGDLALDADREPPGGLDATWLDVDPRRVTLRWPADELGATMTIDPGAAPVHVAVATPDEPPATPVEPVTHAPWALDRLARGKKNAMRLVEPGEPAGLTIELEVTRLR
ncbi:MAG: hypothetical protein K5924_05355 [Chloroflexi bacterium]|nr:hypothetical protein [Chloroflexota bacterium]